MTTRPFSTNLGIDSVGRTMSFSPRLGQARLGASTVRLNAQNLRCMEIAALNGQRAVAVIVFQDQASASGYL